MARMLTRWQRRPPTWLERHAGRATASVVAVVAWLLLARAPIALPPPGMLPPPPEEAPIVIDLEPSPEPEPPPPAEPTENAATVPPREEREAPPAEEPESTPDRPTESEATDAVTELPDLAEEDAPAQDLFLAIPEAAPALAEWVPSARDEQTIRALRLEAERNASRIAEEQRAVQARVTRREVEARGREFTIASDGGLEGIIRTADFSAVGNDELARAVLRRRYGITFEFRNVTPSAGRAFLNAAKSKDETFVASAAAGFYEVMSMPPKAISMMAALELEALMARGHDPSTTRIREIEFGLVPDGGDWRLAVTNLVVEPLRSPHSSLEPPRGD